jgi:hypothetical protein
MKLPPDSDLTQAAEKLFQAARAYREAMKRDPEGRKRLGGVVFIRHEDGSCVVYSESSNYTRQIMMMTYDKHSDQLVFSELPDGEDEA